MRRPRRGAPAPHVEPAGAGPAAVRPRPARQLGADRPRSRSPSEQIAKALYAQAGFRAVTEVAFALPFSFEAEDAEDYVQILADIATRLGPALGWRPGR
jgi:ABC-type amino acid transport substrate-binding protein